MAKKKAWKAWKAGVLASGLVLLSPPASAETLTKERSVVQLPAKVSVSLPASSAVFPAGVGGEVANGFCLMCHSVDMVLLQPPLTLAEWTSEVEKMRHSYGAPLPAEQVPMVAAYLTVLNGRPATSKH